MTHHAKKRFGQHFLHDPNIIDKIVHSIAPAPGDRIVEIGPGLGAITVPVLQQAGELDVIELDRDIIPKLRQKCGQHPGLRVHECDVLKFDFSTLCAGETDRLRVIGNLPYNISTAVLFHLLDFHALVKDMYFMLQKEVVERIVAAPGCHEYGRLSVMMQTWFDTHSLFDVSANCFTPPPKVQSSIIRLVPVERYSQQLGDHESFALLVRQAFSQRRKTLRNTLKPLCDSLQIERAGIDPGTRAEQLTVSDFLRLHQVLQT